MDRWTDRIGERSDGQIHKTRYNVSKSDHFIHPINTSQCLTCARHLGLKGPSHSGATLFAGCVLCVSSEMTQFKVLAKF